MQATLGGLEPAALAGIDALLQLVQASNVLVPAPAPQAPVSDNAVQVAAAALGQLSQPAHLQESVNLGPIAEILKHVCLRHFPSPLSSSDLGIPSYSQLENQKAPLGNRPISELISPTMPSQPLYSHIFSKPRRSLGFVLRCIGQCLTATILPSHQRLNLLIWTLLLFLPWSAHLLFNSFRRMRKLWVTLKSLS